MKHNLIIILLLLTNGLFAQTTLWTESKLKEHWKTNGADQIEGFYIRTSIFELFFRNRSNGGPHIQVLEDKYYIVKSGDKFIIASFTDEFYGIISKVYNSNKYFLSINSKYFINDENVNVSIPLILRNSGELFIDNYQLYLDKDEYVTIGDVFSLVWKPEIQVNNKQIQTGTGFAISTTGIIVTNFHIINGAKTIKVRGVNSDFNKTYKAKVLVSDKNNDLALIQIDDYSFTSLGTIPYTIKTGPAGVGENIFVLGYPLRATMGDEIKLTNGIISSKTGFQGDITSYQVSAPVQPGNSGGPLFDSQGNLIGIINAKHTGAENASYAVKTSYLTNLIDLLTSPLKLQTINSLAGKTLSQQVEIAKKYVYIIEAE